MRRRSSRRSATASFLFCAILFLFTKFLQRRVPKPPAPRYAFATFLGNYTDGDKPARQSQVGGDPDGYFLGARYLNYMLNHNPMTRSRDPIPLLVLATPDVYPYKIQQLTDEGARVIMTEKIPAPSWMKMGDTRYADVLTKLNLWRLTEFDKIAFFDADILVTAPLDGIFGDPASEPRPNGGEGATLDESLPSSYVFAAHPENFRYDHPIPPSPVDLFRRFDAEFLKAHPIPERVLRPDYLNAGFFVMSPGQQIYDLYISKLEQSFLGGSMPEQDLLNSVHNQTGPMPWQMLDWRWNAHYPTLKDFYAGVKSMHDKFWKEESDEPELNNDTTLRKLWRGQIKEMERYYGR